MVNELTRNKISLFTVLYLPDANLEPSKVSGNISQSVESLLIEWMHSDTRNHRQPFQWKNYFWNNLIHNWTFCCYIWMMYWFIVYITLNGACVAQHLIPSPKSLHQQRIRHCLACFLYQLFWREQLHLEQPSSIEVETSN